MATTEPQKWAATLGSTADVNAIPATTPSGSGRASFSGLFPPVTQLPLDQGGIAPERGDFNALFKYLGEYLFYLMQGGTFSYSTDYDYTAGNLVMHGGSLYLCIASNGPGSVIKYPTDAAYWRRLALMSDMPAVGNGVLTIQNNGATVATFSANQAGNTTANISISEIDSQGAGWVRFKNGFQICGQACTSQVKDFVVNFPVAFTSVWSVTITDIGDNQDLVHGKVSHTGTSGFVIHTDAPISGWYWMAIGFWK